VSALADTPAHRRYLMVMPVPFVPLADGRAAVESAFAEHLRELVASLRPRVDVVEVLAPVMDARTRESMRASLDELDPEVDRVRFTAAFGLPRGTVRHLLAMPRTCWMLWKAVSRAGYVHGGPAPLGWPFQNIALLFGWMRGRTTVYVTDIDHRLSPRMSLATGLCSFGVYLRARWLHQPWVSLQHRIAGRLCSALFLKGRDLVRDYGRGRKHVRYILDCAHSSMLVLDDVRLAAKCERLADTSRPLRACYFGRLVPYKGVDRMLRAVASACRAGADVKFDIYGQGECEGALRDLVQQLGLGDRVVFHGARVYGPDWFAELERCDLLISAVLSQDTPRSAIDAQATGMPVLAFDTYYYRELLDQGAGVVVVPWPDTEALAQHLHQLAGDRAELVRLSRRAVQFARENTQEHWLRQRAEWTPSPRICQS
jgi:glycosyltransferase involved in cell wall biosynthesis